MLAIRIELDHHPFHINYNFSVRFSLNIINGFMANQNMMTSMVYGLWFMLHESSRLSNKCHNKANPLHFIIAWNVVDDEFHFKLCHFSNETCHDCSQLIWFHVIWTVFSIVCSSFVRAHFFQVHFRSIVFNIVCTENVYTLTNVFDARDNDRHIMFIPTMTHEMIDR